MDASVADVVDKVERYCVPCISLSNEEFDDALRLVTAIQHTLTVRSQRLRDRHRDRPLLAVYMNDGWSCDIMEAIVTNVGSLNRIRNDGARRQEFLMERGLIRCRDAKEPTDLCFMVGTPRALKHGKKSEHLFAAGCEFMAPLRQLGHRGPLVSLFLFDGNSVNYAQKTLFTGRHEMVYHAGMGIVPDHQRMFLKASELFVGMRCKIHAANKAIEWGLRPWCAGELVDEAFISIASVMKSSANILGCCRRFMLRYVVPRERHDNAEDVRQYWQALSIPARFLDLFCEVDPQWDPTERVLIVSIAMETGNDAWSNISTTIQLSRRVRRWSLTRWGNVNKSGQLFTRGLATGVAGAVTMVMEYGNISNEYIGGFARASSPVCLLLGIASIAPVPVEALIVDMMCDDRLLRRVGQMHNRVQDEMHRVAIMSMLVFRRMSIQIGGITDIMFRHFVEFAMMIIYVFFWREVIMDIYEFPLRMTQGDIDENVRQLDIQEHVNKAEQRMQNFIRFNTHDLVVNTLKTLADAPCSTNLGEQGNAPSRLMSQRHVRYTEKGLRVRATLYSLRPLVRRQKEATELHRARRQLTGLAKMRPRKAHGRHMYFKSQVRESMKGLGIEAPRDRLRVSRGVCKRHSRDYKALPNHTKRFFQVQARQRAAAKIRFISEHTETLNATCRRLELEAKAANDKNNTCRIICAKHD